MRRFDKNIDCIDIDDERDIQMFVVTNSFENLKSGKTSGSITLSDMATVRADICEKKLKLALHDKPESQADVESGKPVPSPEAVRPFIHQLLFRERHFFTVKTAQKDDWIIVRFTLFELPSISKQVGGSRDSVTDIL